MNRFAMPGTPIKEIVQQSIEHEALPKFADKITIPAILLHNHENTNEVSFEDEDVDGIFHEDKLQATEDVDEGIEEGDKTNACNDGNTLETKSNIIMNNVLFQNGPAKNHYWEMPLGR